MKYFEMHKNRPGYVDRRPIRLSGPTREAMQDATEKRLKYLQKMSLEQNTKVTNKEGEKRIIKNVIPKKGLIEFVGYRGSYCPLSWKQV